MSDKLFISVSPHISTPRTTRSIMLDVLIALAPTTLAGVIIFGIRALFVILASVAAAVLSEWLFCLITGKKNTIGDLSAAVTGLLLALNLPASIPIWQTVIGSAFAIIVVKCLFGGIGQNFANPAITGRIFMIVAFTQTTAVALPKIVDTASAATPLVDIKAGNTPALLDLLLGLRGGAIGEVCTAALLIGFVYLLVRRVIKPYAPLVFIGTVFVVSLIAEGFNFENALALCMSGGLLIGAIFMATDYATTPITDLGKVVFGLGCGLITVLIRYFGSYPEGVSYAILIMNILTPYIEKLTARRPFGGEIK